MCSFANLFLNRTFDIVASIAGLVFASLLMIPIALIVKLTSPGPVLYRQTRIGRGHKPFNIIKFRTMVTNDEKEGTSVTVSDNPRITRFGQLLRRTKLDELPQLMNVLKGDMSLVGPRPEVAEIVDRYTPSVHRILDVRPGITSNASLALANEEELLRIADEPDIAYEEVVVPAKVKYAMQHVDNNSFFFYQYVFWKTVWKMSLGRLFPSPPDLFEIRLSEQIHAWSNERGRVIERRENSTL